MAEILLEIIDPHGQIGFEQFPGPVTRIGRNSDNDVTIDGPGIADYHIEIQHSQNNIQVVALSYNGVTLDGRPLPPHVPMPLTESEIIQAGGYEFILLGSEGGGNDDGGSGQGVAQGSAVSPPPQTAPVAAPPAGAMAGAAAGAMAGGAILEAATKPASVFPGTIADPKDELAPPAATATPDAVSQFPTRPLDSQVDQIIAELLDFPDETRTLHVETDNEVNFRVKVTNNGNLVAAFRLTLEGMGWYAVAASEVRLLPGQTEYLPVRIAPPRRPSSRAGTYHFAIVVSSPDYEYQATRLGASLIIHPFHKYDISPVVPSEQKVKKDTAKINLVIYNQGNSDATFQLEGRDNKNDCSIEFMVTQDIYHLSPAEIIVPPARDDEPLRVPSKKPLDKLDFVPGRAIVPAQVLLPRPPLLWVGRNRTITVSTKSLQSDQNAITLSAKVSQKARFGPMAIISTLLFLCISLFACNLYIFRPIGTFTANGAVTGQLSIDAGEEVNLGWETASWRFANVRINPEPGPVDEASGSIIVAPVRDKTYLMEVSTWTSQLLPSFISNVIYRSYLRPKRIEIAVNPVPPLINAFNSDKDQLVLIQGEDNTVILSWDVTKAEDLRLTDQGGILDIFLDEPRGSITLKPENDTIYVLEADNESIDTPVRSTPVAVNVTTPTPTPSPTVPPVQIDYFSVQPIEVLLGEDVVLQWRVDGVESVSIDPIGGSLPPEGGPIDFTTTQAGSINFILSARNILGEEKVEIRTIQVIPPTPTPSPTPTPAAPEIILFSANPLEIVKEQGESVELSWQIDGTVTNVELTGKDLIVPISNLAAVGTFNVTVEDTTQFILTAYNEDATSNAVVEITGVDATPTPEPPTPEPPPPPEPVIEYFRAAAGQGTLSSDVVQISSDTYEVIVGSNLIFSWSTQNADGVELLAGATSLGNQPTEGDTPISNVTQNLTYQLIATGEGGEATAFIHIQIEARIPPSPFNFRGRLADDGEGNMRHRLSWSYLATDERDILGFRLYRGDLVPDVIIADESELGPTTRQFIDPDPPSGCQRYFVKAVYIDVVTQNIIETGSSNGWSSDGC